MHPFLASFLNTTIALLVAGVFISGLIGLGIFIYGLATTYTMWSAILVIGLVPLAALGERCVVEAMRLFP